MSGAILANKWVRRACARHRDDLKSGAARGLYFDPAAADRVIRFFPLLRYFEGEWAGLPIHLHPAQQFATWCIFGWKRADGLRRFRTVYIEEGKKNGKSTWAAGLSLYMLGWDGEPAAQVYSGAVDKEQSRIVWKAAKEIAEKSPVIAKRVEIFRTSIVCGSSFFQPFAKGVKNKQGFNPHFVTLDEIHEHPSRDLYDLIRQSFTARRQPLLFGITNSGFDRSSICYELHENAKHVLDPDHPYVNDALFALIYGLDTGPTGRIGLEHGGDDPFDPAVWIKANPLLDVTTKSSDIKTEAEEARQKPATQNAFFRLKLGVWTSSDTAAITAQQWAECRAPEKFTFADMAGQPAICGMDLSSTQDLTSATWIFPPYRDRLKWRILKRAWIPSDSVAARKIETPNVPFAQWIAEKWVEETPGNLVDYEYVRRALNETGMTFLATPTGEHGEMQHVIVADPSRAYHLETELEKDGFSCVNFRQNLLNFAAPTKFFLDLIAARKLEHNGDPCLAWTATNLMVIEDPSGNQMPAKKRSKEKIDPIVGGIMATARAMALTEQEDQDLEVLVI